jgi:hypothetical protein
MIVPTIQRFSQNKKYMIVCGSIDKDSGSKCSTGECRICEDGRRYPECLQKALVLVACNLRIAGITSPP